MIAFIEKYNLIKIVSKEKINKVSILVYKGILTRLDSRVSYFKLNKELDLQKDYLIFINDYAIPVEIGLITQTEEFEQSNRYDGPLGSIYHKDYTDFYVWSPVSKEINLVLDGKTYKMNNDKQIWHSRVKGDHHFKSYHYEVRNLTYFEKVLDPYAKAGTNDSSFVINLRKLSKVTPSPINTSDKTKSIIYEGHIRDMTINLDVENKGLFVGLTEHSNTLEGSVIEYIKKIGITHLQLLPVTDFLGVDDHNKTALYNWGYNPHQLFLLEGWYSKDPNDPILRINEFIKVINHAHKLGIGINLDVVYNHVYDWQGFSLNKLVPNYMYQFDENGNITSFSGCQNDVASNKYMVRKLIVDNLVFLAKTFKISGFRFDLMGLLDIETMLQIEKELKKINPHIMLYGEGWNMHNTMDRTIRANMTNQKKFRGYSHFNDQFRDIIKGTIHSYGYANGNNDNFEILKQALLGSLNIFDHPNQSVNYIECHDNYTFYDEISLKTNLEEHKKWHYQDLATHLTIIAQGIPFIHAGQEFYRSKKQIRNTYKSKDDVNQITWNPNLHAVDKLKELIAIRKKHKIYTNSNAKVKTVESKFGLVVYTLENGNEKIVHYIQNDYHLRRIPLEDGKVLFASQDYLLDNNNIKITKPGVYAILYKTNKTN